MKNGAGDVFARLRSRYKALQACLVWGVPLAPTNMVRQQTYLPFNIELCFAMVATPGCPAASLYAAAPLPCPSPSSQGIVGFGIGLAALGVTAVAEIQVCACGEWAGRAAQSCLHSRLGRRRLQLLLEVCCAHVTTLALTGPP